MVKLTLAGCLVTVIGQLTGAAWLGIPAAVFTAACGLVLVWRSYGEPG